MADANWEETNRIAGDIWLDSGGEQTTPEKELAIWLQAEQLTAEAGAPQSETIVESGGVLIEMGGTEAVAAPTTND